MATTLDAGQTSPVAPARRTYRWHVIAFVALVVIAAVSITAGIWDHRRHSAVAPLVSYPGYGVSLPRWPVGVPVYFGSNVLGRSSLDDSPRSSFSSLRIDSVVPVISENTAGAKVVVWRCVRATGAPPLLAGMAKDVPAACSSLVLLRRGFIRPGANKGQDDLVFCVTLHRQGIVRVAGLDVRFSVGSHPGKQHVGGQVSVSTR